MKIPVYDNMIMNITIKQKLKERDDLFRCMFETHHAVMLMVDPESGLILDANRAAENFYGYSISKLRGMEISNINMLPPGEIKERLRAVSAGARDFFVFPHRLANGEIRTVEVRSSSIPCEGSHILFSIIHDITDRVKAEEAKWLLSSIVESSDDAIISKDLRGVILSWNAGAEDMYGYTKEEAVGCSISLIVPPDHPDETPMLLEKIKMGEKVEHYETVRMKKDGTLIDVSLSISPVKDFGGKVIGASAIARNITLRKKIEAEREKLLAELQASIAKVKLLSGLLPICASCKKIRDDKGYWNQIETYVSEHSEALFTHAICPECGEKLYPQYYDEVWGKGDKEIISE